MSYTDILLAKKLSGGGGGGGTPTLGALRADAELVKSWAFDKMVVSDLGLSFGSYPTSATPNTIIAASDLETFTVDSAYSYYVMHRYIIIPLYGSTTPITGRMDSKSGYNQYEFHPTRVIKDISGGTSVDASKQTDANRVFINGSCSLVYWSSSTVLESLANTSTAFATNSGLAYANGTLTVKSPTLTFAKGNYLTQTNFSSLTDCRFQYVVEFWRVPNTPFEGALLSEWCHAMDCLATPSHTLT